MSIRLPDRCRTAQGQYDLLIMNSGWFTEMYFGGFVEAVTDIDPGFKLDSDIYTLDNTVYFDVAKKAMAPSGKLISVPIAPLIPLLYYRADLYEEAGLKNASDLHGSRSERQALPQATEPLRLRAARRSWADLSELRFLSVSLWIRRRIFKNPAAGDYSVTLNNEAGRTALDFYLRLAKDAGHPQTASLEQAEVI